MKKNAAIIITYNPSITRLLKNISELNKQGFYVYVIDNHSNNLSLITETSSFQLVQLDKNYGIAKALNIGMDIASNNGAEWVLSLDQDTEIASNLLTEYEKHLTLSQVGALCPNIIKRGEKTKNKNNWQMQTVQRCPTSGFFIKASVWREVGGYNEWMFIDYVDYDICMKILISGYKIYKIYNTFIIQELGKLHVNVFWSRLGKAIHIKKIENFAVTYNHSPVRNYYYVRNSLYYIYEYKAFINAREEYKRVFKWEVKKLILEPNRVKNLRAIIKGIKAYKEKIREDEG